MGTTVMQLEMRTIDGWPDYMVSSEGRVLSKKKGMLRELRAAIHNSYPRVSLCRPGEIREFNVHALVAAAFLEKPDGSQVVRHLDGDPTNNRVENLAYGTYLENEADKARHGRRLVGSKVYGSKLTEETVKQIREEFSRGAPSRKLAKKFGLNVSTAHRVIHGHMWTHVHVPDYSSRKRAFRGAPPGEMHPQAKLSREAVVAIDLSIRSGADMPSLAIEYGVSRQCISHIAAGRTWSHVTGRVTAGTVRKGDTKRCEITGKTALTWWSTK